MYRSKSFPVRYGWPLLLWLLALVGCASANHRLAEPEMAPFTERARLADVSLKTVYFRRFARLEPAARQRLQREQAAWIKRRDILAYQAADNAQGGEASAIEDAYSQSVLESTLKRTEQLEAEDH